MVSYSDSKQPSSGVMATAHRPQPPISWETLSEVELTELIEILRREVIPKFKGQFRGKPYAEINIRSPLVLQTSLTKPQRKALTERIIYTFKQQSRGHQFAVVVFCTQDDLDSGLKTVDFITEDDHGWPLLDSDIPCVPECEEAVTTYLAARPSTRVHAEQYLLKNLEKLTRRWVEAHGELPKHIFLYTWITPCSKCSELIIDTLCSPPYNEIPTTVLYTTNTAVSGDNVEQARQMLKQAEIKVERVPFWSPRNYRS